MYVLWVYVCVCGVRRGVYYSVLPPVYYSVLPPVCNSLLIHLHQHSNTPPETASVCGAMGLREKGRKLAAALVAPEPCPEKGEVKIDEKARVGEAVGRRRGGGIGWLLSCHKG